MNKSSQQGIAIILSMFILSAILAIAMGISTLLLREVQFAKTAGFSIPAFFAADTGIEKILLLRNTPKSFSECTSSASPCVLSNGARFWVVVTCGETNPSVDCAAPGSEIKPNGSTCVSPSYCVESTGEFRGTRRAIEVNY